MPSGGNLLLQYKAEYGHRTSVAFAGVVKGGASESKCAAGREPHVAFTSGVQLAPNVQRPSLVAVRGLTRHVAAVPLEWSVDNTWQFRAHRNFAQLWIKCNLMLVGNRSLIYVLPVIRQIQRLRSILRDVLDKTTAVVGIGEATNVLGGEIDS